MQGFGSSPVDFAHGACGIFFALWVEGVQMRRLLEGGSPVACLASIVDS
jgi:hypothetical protein